MLAYLDALEAGGRYRLMVWPVHCEIGSWGHNVQEDVRRAYNRWEQATLQPVHKVFKGMNAWTENYSALQAEVPDPQDPGTLLNGDLVRQLDRADEIWIAGEASSHCVRATTEHLAAHLPSRRMAKLVLLADCMSPVAGFEREAAAFLADLRARGARVATSAECTASAGLDHVLELLGLAVQRAIDLAVKRVGPLAQGLRLALQLGRRSRRGGLLRGAFSVSRLGVHGSPGTQLFRHIHPATLQRPRGQAAARRRNAL